jgi:hypothetical protein
MTKLKQQSFEELLEMREKLIADQAKQLAELEVDIRARCSCEGIRLGSSRHSRYASVPSTRDCEASVSRP